MFKYKDKMYIIILFNFLFCFSLFSDPSKPGFFAEIPKEKYLIGDFEPNDSFQKYTEKKNGRVFYMRKDVYLNFIQMKTDYKKYAIKKNLAVKDISIVSAFRGYEVQKNIWEKKFSGKTKMRKNG